MKISAQSVITGVIVLLNWNLIWKLMQITRKRLMNISAVCVTGRIPVILASNDMSWLTLENWKVLMIKSCAPFLI
jgi:hypothetical protein